MKIILRSALIGIVVISLLMVGGYFGYQYYFGTKSGLRYPVVSFDPYSMEIRTVKADLHQKPETLADLIADADVVVRGYLFDNARQQIEYGIPNRDGTPQISSGFTLSTLVVKECYKGTLLPGDKVPFVERYYIENYEEEIITETKDGRYRKVIPHERLVTYNNYMPALPYTEYVFFLNKQPLDSTMYPGCYMIRNMELGRYPFLTEKEAEKGTADMDNIRLGLNAAAPADTLTTYLALYDEIIAAYIDPPTEEEIAEALAREAEALAKAEAKAAGQGKLFGIPIMYLIAGGVAILALAGGGAAFILIRRRNAAFEEEEEEEAAAEDGNAETEKAASPETAERVLV